MRIQRFALSLGLISPVSVDITKLQECMRSGSIESQSIDLISVSAASSGLAAIVTNLERQSSRVVVALADWRDLFQLMNSVREIIFDFVWVIPPEHTSSSLAEATVDLSNPNSSSPIDGLLAVHLSQNHTAQEELLQRLQARNSTLFPSDEPLPLANDVVRAHDAILLWGSAISRIARQNTSATSNYSSVVSQIRHLRPGIEWVFPGGNYSFSSSSMERTGLGHLTNLRFNVSRSQLCVGSFVQGSELILRFGTSIVFADGSSRIRMAQDVPSITFGLVWPRAELDPATYSGYFDAAALAVADINANGTIIPGFELRTIFHDNSDTLAETLVAGIEVLTRGAVAVIGPDRSSQAIALQYYLGSLDVPAISFSATSDTLSDPVQYPSFFRTVRELD